MKTRTGFVVIAAFCCSCFAPNQQPTGLEKLMADKPFVSGGNIEMQLDSGDYVIRPAAEDRIRINFGSNSGSATAALASTGAQAILTVKDTPNKNFKASIEVPAKSNLVIHLKAGDLDLAAITGNKDINSGAGDVKVEVGDPGDYSGVDASVKVGDLNAGPFGSDSGIGSHLIWTGHGKFTLRASLGAGDLVLRSK